MSERNFFLFIIFMFILRCILYEQNCCSILSRTDVCLNNAVLFLPPSYHFFSSNALLRPFPDSNSSAAWASLFFSNENPILSFNIPFTSMINNIPYRKFYVSRTGVVWFSPGELNISDAFYCISLASRNPSTSLPSRCVQYTFFLPIPIAPLQNSSFVSVKQESSFICIEYSNVALNSTVFSKVCLVAGSAVLFEISASSSDTAKPVGALCLSSGSSSLCSSETSGIFCATGSVACVFPRYGSASGGQLVSVFMSNGDSNCLNFLQAFCSFGLAVVPAIFDINSGGFHCIAPAGPANSSVLFSLLLISNNSELRLHSNNLFFTFLASSNPLLISLPSTGSMTAAPCYLSSVFLRQTLCPTDCSGTPGGMQQINQCGKCSNPSNPSSDLDCSGLCYGPSGNCC